MDTYGTPEGYLFNLHTCSSAEAKRMWKDSYAGMCNRAIVLDEVREIFFIALTFVEAMANAKSSAIQCPC